MEVVWIMVTQEQVALLMKNFEAFGKWLSVPHDTEADNTVAEARFLSVLESTYSLLPQTEERLHFLDRIKPHVVKVQEQADEILGENIGFEGGGLLLNGVESVYRQAEAILVPRKTSYSSQTKVSQEDRNILLCTEFASVITTHDLVLLSDHHCIGAYRIKRVCRVIDGNLDAVLVEARCLYASVRTHYGRGDEEDGVVVPSPVWMNIGEKVIIECDDTRLSGKLPYTCTFYPSDNS